mgnify:CR=1 FL=1
MINGNLKFFPILMDECKNNPEKVQKKIKYLKYANYIYFFASIIGFTLDSILNAHSKIDFTLTNLVLGVVIFFFAMLPLLFSISWIHELSEGVRYFKEKRSDKEFILGQMRELLKKRKNKREVKWLRHLI